MTISVRLGEELEQRLENLAKRTGRTKSHYIREVLLERLEDLEDLYIAERVLENIGKIYSQKEIDSRFGLAD